MTPRLVAHVYGGGYYCQLSHVGQTTETAVISGL